MASRKKAKAPPAPKPGLMPVGAIVTIHSVRTATQDGPLYRLEGIDGWQVWHIDAEGYQLKDESYPQQFFKGDQQRIRDWAQLTHLKLKRPAAG